MRKNSYRVQGLAPTNSPFMTEIWTAAYTYTNNSVSMTNSGNDFNIMTMLALEQSFFSVV